MSTPLALFTLIALPWSHAGAPSEVSHVGGWTVRAHLERFTGAHVCSVTRPKVTVERQAVVFHLPRSVDTSGAVYRIDGGAPFWSRNDQAELARQGFALHGDSLTNPSGGLVRIPLDRLASGRSVEIEAAADHRPFRFSVYGLDTALAAAKATGCAEAGPS